MSPEVIQTLRDSFFGSFQPPFTGSLIQWMTDNVLMDDNKFNINVCPWLREIYEAIEDPCIDMVIIQGAAGTFKTGVQDTVVPWIVSQNPGKILRVNHIDDVAMDFTKQRLIPILETCKPVAALCDKGKVKTSRSLILFPHMDIKSSGPTDKIQYSYSCRFLQIDEGHLIEEPFENMFKRVRKNYKRTKIIITSTCGEQTFDKDGNLIGDQLSALVDKTTIKRRAWKCPSCNRYQVWRWAAKRDGEDKPTYSGINWGKPILKPNGMMDEEATARNAKLECHYCRHQLEDSEKSRMSLEQTAIYQTIKEGNSRHLTFQYPAWVAPFHTYKAAALEYFSAKALADSRQYEKLKEFYKQVATEEWNNRIEKVRSKLTFEKFDSNAEWPEEKFRFMGVDFQGDATHRRPYMIVAFDAIGNGRVINYGEAHSWPEIENLAIKYKVQKENGENAHFVGLDCGYDWNEVAKESVRHGLDKEFDEGGSRWAERFGWLCLRGDGKVSFPWDDEIQRAVSPQTWYDTGSETPPARIHFWSNKSIKNLVASIRDGHNKIKLAINNQDENLTRQLNSEHPDEFGDWKSKVKGSANHWFDCLCMCYAMGILAGIPFFGADSVPKV